MSEEHAQPLLDLEVWTWIGWVVWNLTLVGYFFWRYVL